MATFLTEAQRTTFRRIRGYIYAGLCLFWSSVIAAHVIKVSARQRPRLVPTNNTGKYGAYIGCIGNGSTASVFQYRAADGSLTAMKRFRSKSPHVTQEEYDHMIANEVEVSLGLDHPNIIRAFQADIDRTQPALFMESGVNTLWELAMETSGLSVGSAACMFRQVIDGAAYLHQQRTAHRDLKLSNVVISANGVAKLIDFGNAVRFDPNLTTVQGIVGTVPGVPPEAYWQHSYHPAPADVWALAICYCQMILPSLPWRRPEHQVLSFGLFEPHAENEATAGRGTCPGSLLVGDNSETCSDAPLRALQGTIRSLVSFLPAEARAVILSMLEPLPNRRVTLDYILKTEWIRGLEGCSEVT